MKAHFGLNTVLVLSVVSALCVISACSKTTPVKYTAPIPCISASADSVYINRAVTFWSCSQGATSYAWNFGDGSTATTDTATHTYTTPGTYVVTMTPSSASGAGNTETINFKVKNTGGSWTFEGTNYIATLCSAFGDIIEADYLSLDGNTYLGNLTCSFYGGTLPTTGGTYIVSTGRLPQSPGQVGIAVTINGNSEKSYQSTGGNGSNQTVSVTLTGGKIGVSGTAIEMGNSDFPYDSASVTFSIHQLQ